MTRTRHPNRIRTSLFYILTEGEKTEPNYFQSSMFRNDRTFPKINPGKCPGNDANGLKQWAESIMKTDFVKGDRIWIVLDKDENDLQKLHNLKEWCEENDVGLAFSNPCFELWLLIHFNYVDSSMNKEDLIAKLTQNLREQYDKSKDYSHIFSEKIETAVRNARTLREHNGQSGKRCNQNPFTNIDMLIADLMKFLKESV